MTPERWSRVKELFAAAADIPAADRPALLGRETGDDPALIAEVDSLLASHDAASTFLEEIPQTLRAAAIDTSDAAPGERVGVYRLVELIGTGGMGAVYKAVRDDDQYHAEVAIKLMRADLRNPLAGQRFRNERQILAALDHRNIARLLDGGTTPEGLPYVVMELVMGKPIDAYCDENGLETRQRLQLFLQVCAAVSYAHQHLVVHRDLKPNNILVTADGSAKLLDFGIAKLLEPQAITGARAEETRTLLREMTLEYASPEQVGGGTITTASDVYSLGIVLYRLITGRSPYRARGGEAARIAEILGDASPARPSLVQDATRPPIDADLDHILLMALRKEPSRRYGSVEQFATDLRNYINGLPVTARRGTLGYRAGKFARRNKVPIAAALLVAVSLVTGLALTMRQARIAERERAVAQRHFDSVRKIANVLLSDVYDEINALPGGMKARMNIVNTAEEYLEALSREPGSDPVLKLEVASAWRRLGDIHGGQNSPGGGDTTRALESYGNSIRLIEEVLVAEPGNRLAAVTLVKSLVLNARTLLVTQGAAPALANAERAAVLAEASPEGFRDEFERVNLLMVTYQTQAEILAGLDRPAEAMSMCDRMIAISQTHAAARPDDVQALKLLRNAYANASIVVDPRQPAAVSLQRTLSLMREALAVSERLLAIEPDSVEHKTRLAEQRLNLGDAYHFADRHSEALEMYRLAEPVLARAAEDRDDARARLALAMNRSGLGATLVKLGDMRSAAPLYDSAETEFRELLRGDPENLFSQFQLSQLEMRRGEMYVLLADRAANHGAQRDFRAKAIAALEPAVAGMQKVDARSTLTGTDRLAWDAGLAQLARARTAAGLSP